MKIPEQKNPLPMPPVKPTKKSGITNKECIAILENIKTQGKAFFSQRLALDHAIKALHIVDIIETGFTRDSNLMMDADDWKNVKTFADEEVENDN